MRWGDSEGITGGTRSEVRYFNFSLLWDTVGARCQGQGRKRGTKGAQEVHERYTYGH